jgi:hypothetical protein
MAGYSKPETIGPRVLNNRQVAAYLEQKLEESGALTVAELLARLSTIATLDPLEFVSEGEDGKWAYDIKKIKRLKKGHLIKDLKIHQNGKIELSFHNAVDAQVQLAKIHGLNKERLVIEDERGEAATDRVLAILGGLAELARSVNSGAGGGEPQPGALCGGGEQWEVVAGPAPEINQPTPALAGPEGDRQVGCDPRPETWEE